MTLDMMDLRERFIQHPLLPDEVIQQQNRWRQRWGQPTRAVEPGERWAFYFDPSELGLDDPNDPRRRLRFALIKGERGTKSFITGSKGAGKSTTAFSLWADPRIAARYTLLGFTIEDYLNLTAVDAGQIIALMIAHLIERLRDIQSAAALGDLEDRATVKKLKEILREVRPSAKLEQVNVNVFGAFTAVFKHSTTARDAFRQFLDGRAEEVMNLLDELDALLEAHTGKPTLFIIDDLDKISAECHDDVFHRRLVLLRKPRCAAVYSYPLEVDHDPHFSHLKRGQPNRYLLANVKLADQPGGPMRPEGRAVLTEFVTRRLDGREFADVIRLTQPEWDRVLHYSAGNFRELSRILWHAFEIAAMGDADHADRRCFELALQRMRADYNMFVQTRRGFLLKVRAHRETPTEEFDPELLSTLLAAFVVVEYPNEPGWLDVNPIVDDLLDGRKSLLTAPE
ncbi:MAG: hypothetical protein H6705_08630 [Myxococcales bacterium]|nr:hypothetical protein [Myxococcales bacterium]